jgi:hypothetical protein
MLNEGDVTIVFQRDARGAVVGLESRWSLRPVAIRAAKVRGCDGRGRGWCAGCRGVAHRHDRALRSVADRLFRVLIAWRRTGSLYEPSCGRAHEQVAERIGQRWEVSTVRLRA